MAHTRRGPGSAAPGDRGDALYFVASGRLEVVPPAVEQDSPADEQAHTAILLPGDAISEMRTLTDSHGAVAVRCIAAARLVKLAKDRLERYLAARPDVAEELRRVLTPRFYRAEMIEALQNMFGDLTVDSLADIEQCLTWRRVARGDALLRPGKASNALFVVVSGRLQIWLRTTRREKGPLTRSPRANRWAKRTSSPMKHRRRPW